MSHLWFLFGSSFLVALTGAMMPGPVLTATIGESARYGARAGPLMILGHGIVEIALLLAILAGAAAWLVADTVQAVLGLVGGVALIAMGALTILTSRAAARQATAASENRAVPAHGAILTGMITTCSNPYWYLWWATIGLAYASHSLQAGVAGLASFFSGHILADLGWYSLVSVSVAGGRRWLAERGYRAVLILCGVVLLGLGAWFAWMGRTLFAAAQ